jgi:HPr kinase/phosphorylase
MTSLSIKDLFEGGEERLGLRLVSGHTGLSRIIKDPVICTSQQAFKKHPIQLQRETIVILLPEDVLHLERQSERDRSEILSGFSSAYLVSVIVPSTDRAADFLVQWAENTGVPLFLSRLDAFLLESRMIGHLRERLHHIGTLQGVFVEVSGLGILLTGESGVGKSECALELMARGHKLVSDDVIEIEERGDRLYGRSPEEIKYLMEIKGLGIINVGTIFGTHAVREEMPIDLVVEFVPVEKVGQADDAVSGSAMRQIMGVSVPLVRLPARHGSNMATVIEVLAKDYLAKRRRQGKTA